MRTALLVASLAIAFAASAGEVKSYGQPFPDGGTALPISVAAADVQTHVGKPMRFSGRITQVCQAKGCWVMLEDDGKVARVMMRDHTFYVPKDAKGRAEVYGVLSEKVLSKEAVDHLSEDAGNGLPVAERELRIVADGIRIEG